MTARSAMRAGVGRAGSSTADAPTDSGKKQELPMPYAKKSFGTDRQRSSGRMPSTRAPYVSATDRIEACRCTAAFGRPVVPEV